MNPGFSLKLHMPKLLFFENAAQDVKKKNAVSLRVNVENNLFFGTQLSQVCHSLCKVIINTTKAIYKPPVLLSFSSGLAILHGLSLPQV